MRHVSCSSTFLWNATRKHRCSFYTVQYNTIKMLFSPHNCYKKIQLEVTGVSITGTRQWHFLKGTACLFLKWHLLSVCTLSLAPSLACLWHIPSREVKWYLKFRSISLKEINSGFRWFSCLSTCDSWRAGGVSWPSFVLSPSGLPVSPGAYSESSSIHLYNYKAWLSG